MQSGDLAQDADPAQLAFELQALLVAANTAFVLRGDRGTFARSLQAIRTRLEASDAAAEGAPDRPALRLDAGPAAAALGAVQRRAAG